MFLNVQPSGEVSISGIDKTATIRGSAFYIAAFTDGVDSGGYALDEEGKEVLKVRAIRKNGMVELVVSTTVFSNNGETQTLGTLPEEFRPLSEIVEEVSYGEDKYSMDIWKWKNYDIHGYQPLSSTKEDGHIYKGASYCYFKFVFEQALNYDVAITPMHANGLDISDRHKDKDGNYFYGSRTDDFLPLVIPKGTSSKQFPLFSNYNTSGEIYTISAKVKGIGETYEELISMEITVD